ncbi:hypothetical protein ACFFVB_06225 [Formosa undariae]|uniref:Uncharacterized protein n=1 Tax=Formosa undariae TaxID=1325436 RepID=A0ABV5F0G9_9FLAO
MINYFAIIGLFFFSTTVVNGQRRNAEQAALPEEVICKIVEGDTLKLQFLYPEGAQMKKKDSEKYYMETVYEADFFLESLGYLKGKPTI